ncbi:hypothetical protein [Schaalia georgiae]|uniref:hypothetical protein n=1 Tax=Schaalia georgiae TaxID=52768 RepID=UPI0009D98A4D|nr:hypothetical protein [Schaalia georgiae]
MAYRPFPIMEVDIHCLLLDLENYRIPTRREDQESALKYLFASEDVFGAMKSILKHGYFDNEVPIVTPASKTGGDQTYVVLEGNRRVSALKALQNPMIIPGRMKEIQSLAKRYALEVQELPTRIRVLVAPDRATAAPHVARLHTGVSKKRWSLDQQATFYYSLLDEETSVDAVKAQYPGVAVSRFMRMAVMRRFLNAVRFKDPSLHGYVAGDELKMSSFEYAYKKEDIAELIGVKFDKNGLFLPAGSTPEQVAAKLTEDNIVVLNQLLSDFRSGRLNTRSPELKISDERYFSYVLELRAIVESPVPAPGSDEISSRGGHANGVKSAVSNPGYDGKVNEPSSGQSTSNRGDRDRPQSNGSVGLNKRGPNHPKTKDKLDLSGLDYSSAPVGLKCRYIELRKVSVSDLPITAAVLLRTVLEATIKARFENGDESVKGELSKVFIHVKSFYGRDKALKSSINCIDSGSAQKAGSIQWFNWLSHGLDATVQADDVRQAWMVVNPLLRRLLQALPGTLPAQP